MMRFVDTNVFLRYITGDDLEKQAQAAALFERAERGEIDLCTSEAVLGEIVFVLSSPILYNRGKKGVAQVLNVILAKNAIRIPERQRCIRAVNMYATLNLDFTDALIAATMQDASIGEIYSYDRHFERIDGIERIEP